jgi:hypothetical protein
MANTVKFNAAMQRLATLKKGTEAYRCAFAEALLAAPPEALREIAQLTRGLLEEAGVEIRYTEQGEPVVDIRELAEKLGISGDYAQALIEQAKPALVFPRQ